MDSVYEKLIQPSASFSTNLPCGLFLEKRYDEVFVGRGKRFPNSAFEVELVVLAALDSGDRKGRCFRRSEQERSPRRRTPGPESGASGPRPCPGPRASCEGAGVGEPQVQRAGKGEKPAVPRSCSATRAGPEAPGLPPSRLHRASQ